MGDAVDNIPGVPGVGPKTAAELLKHFGSIDGIYSRIGEVKSARLKSALSAAEAAVRRNQRLVRLKDVTDRVVDLPALRPQAMDAAALAKLFRACGFRSMLAEIEASSGQQGLLLEN
jgi:DNA polymerase-1